MSNDNEAFEQAKAYLHNMHPGTQVGIKNPSTDEVTYGATFLGIDWDGDAIIDWHDQEMLARIHYSRVIRDSSPAPHDELMRRSKEELIAELLELRARVADRAAELDDQAPVDDKAVHFERPGERLVHVHRGNIVANIKHGWTRPTLLVAGEGHTPVFASRVLLRGPSQIVERPPGVHIVVDDATPIVALDAEGTPLPMPEWAAERVGVATMQDLMRVTVALGGALDEDSLRGARAAFQRLRVRLLGLDCDGGRP